MRLQKLVQLQWEFGFTICCSSVSLFLIVCLEEVCCIASKYLIKHVYLISSNLWAGVHCMHAELDRDSKHSYICPFSEVKVLHPSQTFKDTKDTHASLAQRECKTLDLNRSRLNKVHMDHLQCGVRGEARETQGVVWQRFILCIRNTLV